jgi:hypothetical protein
VIVLAGEACTREPLPFLLLLPSSKTAGAARHAWAEAEAVHVLMCTCTCARWSVCVSDACAVNRGTTSYHLPVVRRPCTCMLVTRRRCWLVRDRDRPRGDYEQTVVASSGCAS